LFKAREISNTEKQATVSRLLNEIDQQDFPSLQNINLTTGESQNLFGDDTNFVMINDQKFLLD
jgi:hypothetical protein